MACLFLSSRVMDAFGCSGSKMDSGITSSTAGQRARKPVLRLPPIKSEIGRCRRRGRCRHRSRHGERQVKHARNKTTRHQKTPGREKNNYGIILIRLRVLRWTIADDELWSIRLLSHRRAYALRSEYRQYVRSPLTPCRPAPRGAASRLS